MGTSTDFPKAAKSLVEFSAVQSGALSLTDRIEADGKELMLSSGKSDLDFMVEYQGYWFSVNVEQRGTKSHLHIHGAIGKLPYTYESAFSRANVLAVVRAAGRALGGSVQVDSKQNILLIDTIEFEGSLSPKVVLAETTKVLLMVKPYLQLVTILQPPKQASTPAPAHYKKKQDSLVEEEQTDAEKVNVTLKPVVKAHKTFKVKLTPKVKIKPK
ncbi:hypothetical protein MTBPR1_30313 [Candidatus Terasakiella magnetica]|uniref:Uncharacterized protein n=1 Tax=Candidatus Terasakiella magnetica TaxID=1867952 RepID=A0A1C3RI32_9PROT|nr:hypothetical protein [Candidatus Terasakiella magnetica]SCA56943.1 hypothetical protein MTBPR1_30313 [Candidatus Terasakiella magnetica]